LLDNDYDGIVEKFPGRNLAGLMIGTCKCWLFS